MSPTSYQIAPMAKPRPRVTRNGKHTYMPAKYVKWKADCAKLGLKLPDAFSVTFHFAMPKSWSIRKKAAYWNTMHCQKPDLDNALGGLFDAARKDDAGIWRVRAEKIWDYDASIVIDAL